jgi:diadenosine tetraphosphatase ApaH/serine/threonine PP2A family protein phosphatase
LAGVIDRPILHASMHLDIEWQAAGIHPWDRDLPEERQEQFFTIRLLEDTVLRIRSLFTALPDIDTVRIKVLGPIPQCGALLEGTIARARLRDCETCRSPAMCLKLLGVTFQLRGGRLEPIEK